MKYFGINVTMTMGTLVFCNYEPMMTALTEFMNRRCFMPIIRHRTYNKIKMNNTSFYAFS